MKKYLEPQSRFISFTYSLIRNTVGRLIRFIWVKEVAYKNKNLPKKPFIVAANHQSFFDFLSLSSVFPKNIHFLSAEKFFSHKLWRILMISTGQIKVPRTEQNKDAVHQSVRKLLEQEKTIGIFPEGTRSPHKDEMVKAYTGVAKYALEHKVPVVPVGIIGAYDVMPKGGKLSFKKQIGLYIGEPIDFTEYHGKHDDRDICRFITEKIIQEIETLSNKKYPHYQFDHLETARTGELKKIITNESN